MIVGIIITVDWENAGMENQIIPKHKNSLQFQRQTFPIAPLLTCSIFPKYYIQDADNGAIT